MVIYLLGAVAMIHCAYSCLFDRDKMWQQNLSLGELIGLHPISFQRTELWDQVVTAAGIFAGACAVAFALLGLFTAL